MMKPLTRQKIYKRFAEKLQRRCSLRRKDPLIRPGEIVCLFVRCWAVAHPVVQGPILTKVFSTYTQGRIVEAPRSLLFSVTT